MFSQLVAICKEQNLIEFNLLATDSVKLRAKANYKQSKTLEGIKKEETKVKERLKEILETAGDTQSAKVEEIRALTLRAEWVLEAKKVLSERLEEKGREASEKKQELLEKEKVNITDQDAHIMQQANGEKNPAFSITTATDVGQDIATHSQVNAQDNDPAALSAAIEKSRRKTGDKHREGEADAGFASMQYYEQLEAERQEALIPDRRMQAKENQTTAKREYDRRKFAYRADRDTYRCPCRETLEKTGSVEMNGRSYYRYEKPGACARFETDAPKGRTGGCSVTRTKSYGIGCERSLARKGPSVR